MKNITSAFVGYFKQQPDWVMSSYLVIASLVCVYLGTIILLRFIKKTDSPFVRLQSAIFIACCVSLLLLVAYTVYFTYFNSYIYKQHLQAVLILLVICHIGILVKTISNLNKAIKSDNIKVIGIISGPIIQKEKLITATIKNRKLKAFVFLGLLPFIILLFKPKENYLYSIVFDNSASMENQLIYAKDALKEVVNNLNNNSSFVVSSVPICNTEQSCLALAEKAKRNLKDIISVNDTGTLLASTNVFAKKEEFFSFINSGGIEITGAGSPIYECIWQNFIESVKLNESQSYTKKKLIILTDGNDNLYAKVEGCIAPVNCITDYSYKAVALSDFYSDLSFINYGEADNINMFKSCSALNVLNGYDYNSFKNSFYEQLEDIFFDKQFLWIIAIFLLLGISVIFTLK
jgi:hypothetical protein